MDLVTVFRSADARAEEDATAIARQLDDAGIAARLLDDSAPGVPLGAWEVCVAAQDGARADALIAMHPLEDEISNPDQSHDLDMVTVFRSAPGTADSDSEALTVKGLLDAAGLPAMLVGDARFPNLSEQVRVPKLQAPEARRVIADALAEGPEAAEQEEAESERP